MNGHTLHFLSLALSFLGLLFGSFLAMFLARESRESWKKSTGESQNLGLKSLKTGPEQKMPLRPLFREQPKSVTLKAKAGAVVVLCIVAVASFVSGWQANDIRVHGNTGTIKKSYVTRHESPRSWSFVDPLNLEKITGTYCLGQPLPNLQVGMFVFEIKYERREQNGRMCWYSLRYRVKRDTKDWPVLYPEEVKLLEKETDYVIPR